MTQITSDPVTMLRCNVTVGSVAHPYMVAEPIMVTKIQGQTNLFPIEVHTIKSGGDITNADDIPSEILRRAQHHRIVCNAPFAIVIVAAWSNSKILNKKHLTSIRFFRINNDGLDGHHINIARILDCAARILMPHRYSNRLSEAQPSLIADIPTVPLHKRRMISTMRTAVCKSPGKMTLQFRGSDFKRPGGEKRDNSSSALCGQVPMGRMVFDA